MYHKAGGFDTGGSVAAAFRFRWSNQLTSVFTVAGSIRGFGFPRLPGMTDRKPQNHLIGTLSSVVGAHGRLLPPLT